MDEEWEMISEVGSGRWWIIHPAEQSRGQMAHSFTGPSGRSYTHNSDFSGNIWFNAGVGSISIPAEDVLALAAEYMRNTQIAKLEQASDEEILGWKW